MLTFFSFHSFSCFFAINNNFATNGGYIFSDYQWYRGDKEITEARGKGYIQEPGGLKKNVAYTATLTYGDGKTIGTCPAVIANVQTKAAVYPNPVMRGQSVRIIAGETGEAVMRLFGTAGNIIAVQNLSAPVAELAMPDTPGTYVLQITVNGNVETFKIVVE